jgi:hypothetical protein
MLFTVGLYARKEIGGVIAVLASSSRRRETDFILPT